jgi:enamine deaminase RidA (YjgF/YER057c/UK114 family)
MGAARASALLTEVRLKSMTTSSRSRKTVAWAALALLAVMPLPAKKKKEDETQALQLPKELPAAVSGETRRLSFVVTPLSAKGLLTQQVRDALKNLEHQASGDPVLAIRAFVAGSGDLRRVRDLVSETFTEKRQPLPVLSLIQAGALPLSGAQVVLEATVNGRKDLYPGGLAFFPAYAVYADDPLSPVTPLLDHSLTELQAAVRASGVAPSDVLRVTCFLSALERVEEARQRVQSEYPRAAQNWVQTERAPQRAVAACEAIAGILTAGRSDAAASPRLALRKVPDAGSDSARIAMVGAPHLVLTGTQISFGFEERDAHLALERLGKTLEPLGVSMRDVAYARFYPLSRRIEEQMRRQLPSFFELENPPALSVLEFEGLSAADAGFAVDAVAAKD